MITRRNAIVALGSLIVVTPAFAADETFKGDLVCAKCYLNKPDAKECQDVLLVKDANGGTVEYYITKNTVAQESGEACTQKIRAEVVGTVSEKDGRKWITASKITKN